MDRMGVEWTGLTRKGADQLGSLRHARGKSKILTPFLVIKKRNLRCNYLRSLIHFFNQQFGGELNYPL